MIPDTSNPIWKKIVTGEINHHFSNYVLQIQVYKIQHDVKQNIISIDNAIKTIHQLCVKYSRAVSKDINKILNS